jgi:AraC-like DNA-binding protein
VEALRSVAPLLPVLYFPSGTFCDTTLSSLQRFAGDVNDRHAVERSLISTVLGQPPETVSDDMLRALGTATPRDIRSTLGSVGALSEREARRRRVVLFGINGRSVLLRARAALAVLRLQRSLATIEVVARDLGWSSGAALQTSIRRAFGVTTSAARSIPLSILLSR